MQWALQDARNQLSEVVDNALNEGAQEIRVHGREDVTVIATRELRALRRQPSSLVAFFQASPLATEGLELPARDIEEAQASMHNQDIEGMGP